MGGEQKRLYHCETLTIQLLLFSGRSGIKTPILLSIDSIKQINAFIIYSTVKLHDWYF
jgi:hypothetical protein